MKKYLLFIGIDISKKWIDVASSRDGQIKQMLHHQFDNSISGFKQMLKWLRSTQAVNLKSSSLFCMEHTGVYSIPLCCFLQDQGLDYILDSALRIKRSLGIKRGKDDKADSKSIGKYLHLHHKELKVNKLPSKVLIDLKNLLAYRNRLISKSHAIKTGVCETRDFTPKSEVMDWISEDSEELVEVFKAKIKKVESRLKELVKQNDQIKEVFDLATSVKGVGLIIALQMIVHTNCFKAFDSSRQFACYVGIAPFHQKSGTSVNAQAKVSKLGHIKLKALLTNGVMSAIQNDKELKAYYERKVAQGKIKYKVLNAVKNKLVSRVFATVKRGTPYVELLNYT